jgi:uncharacterized membrane protein YfcA
VQTALLVLAGIGAGLVGTMAGLASLISYPALIAVGLGPVAANVTNTLALMGTTIGGVAGSRPELAGRGPQIRRLAVPAVIGGVTGATLLLVTPAEAFEKVVPWLIGVGALAVQIRPRPVPHDEPPAERESDSRLLWGGVLVVSVYGGYFGAAAGVLLLALLLVLTGDSVVRGSALRTALLGTANAVAGVSFAIFGPVDWPAAAALFAGLVMGSRLGPVLLRHSPDRLMRILISIAGLGLAVKLGLDAY